MFNEVKFRSTAMFAAVSGISAMSRYATTWIAPDTYEVPRVTVCTDFTPRSPAASENGTHVPATAVAGKDAIVAVLEPVPAVLVYVTVVLVMGLPLPVAEETSMARPTPTPVVEAETSRAGHVGEVTDCPVVVVTTGTLPQILS